MPACAADAPRPTGRLRGRLRERLRGTVLYPRWINTVHAEPLLRRVAARASGTLLDVGCGQRPFEPLFTARVERYVGLDWPSSRERARADVVGDALALPLRAGTVDTVLATELMEHLPSPDAFLTEVARVLRRPGVLILTVPFLEPLHEEPRDFYRFTPHGLRALLERHGFAVEQVLAKGGWWSVVVGSFVNQTLYDWANPEGPDGRRRDHPLVLALVVPLCSLAQIGGYLLDQVFRSRRYTLGYVVLASVGTPRDDRVLKRDLDRMACPACRGALHEETGQEAGEPGLRCVSGHRHAVSGGIPRFVPADTYAGSFGYQWNAFAHLQLDSKNGTDFSEARFRDITGWGPEDLRGRSVLEAGCGAGRFAEVAWRKYGADLVAFDLSSAVEACRANLSPDPPLVVQASIGEPPFPSASFDVVYCIGVLQHTPDPLGYVRVLCRLVKPGGRIGLWIYENDWKNYVGTLGFKRLLRPFVSRWPRERQLSFCRALTAAFFPLVRMTRPLGLPGRVVARLLPVASAHIAHVPLRPRDLREWVLLDTFDMYASAYDEPQRFDDVARVLAEEGFQDVRRHPHGGVSVTARRG